jgi:hypothetical protein
MDLTRVGPWSGEDGRAGRSTLIPTIVPSKVTVSDRWPVFNRSRHTLCEDQVREHPHGSLLPVGVAWN